MSEFWRIWRMLDPTSRCIFTCLALALFILAGCALLWHVTPVFALWVIAVAMALGAVGGIIKISAKEPV